MTRNISKKVTMDDVARVANVSKPTVSRALRGHKSVTEETRIKVLNTARSLGYAVNRNAQKLRQRHTNTVAVILDLNAHPERRISDPFIFELLSGVSVALAKRNQDLLLSPSNMHGAESYQDLVRSRVVDGFLFLGQGDKEALLDELAKLQVPFVIWGGQTPDHSYCTVGSDNFVGGLLAGHRFVDHQRKNILFIGNSDHLELRQRRDGLISGMERAAYKFTISEIKNAGFSFRDSYELISHYIDHNPAPDGIFAYSDTAAIAAIKIMNDLSLTPLEDYSLIGYNDISQASYFSPPLTTVKQDTFLAGEVIVEKYIDLIDGKPAKSTVLPTKITIRQT